MVLNKEAAPKPRSKFGMIGSTNLIGRIGDKIDVAYTYPLSDNRISLL